MAQTFMYGNLVLKIAELVQLSCYLPRSYFEFPGQMELKIVSNACYE